jgi:hypothetical protein
MTHWMEQDFPDAEYPARCCERCHNPMDDSCQYAWCKECGDTGTCHHGNRPHECNACFVESDIAYDAKRSESSKTPEKMDEP